MRARPELPAPALMLVTDSEQVGERTREIVAAALDGGVNMVQLRAKTHTARELYALALRLRDLTAGRALLLINDRLDVARAVQADGAHLAGHSLPPVAARAALGEAMLLGVSVHSVAEAEA